MNSTSTIHRLLILTGPNSRSGSVIDQFRSQFDVVVATSIEQAVNELRHGRFDAVFADSADFLPLDRAVASQQSGLILDTIGEGICIADQAGNILWANKKMKLWPVNIQDRVCKVCSDAFNTFVNQVSPAQEGEVPLRSRKFSFSIDDTQFFELICSPVLDSRRQVTQVVAICWDASSGRRLQQKIDAIDQAGRELVRLESEAIAKLSVGQRLKLLEEKIIKYCRQLMHFDHFAIRLLDRKTNKLEMVICVGLPSEAVEIELLAMPEGNGISGYVAATGRSYICSDVSKDPRYVMGLGQAKSSLTVPLMLHDKTIGIFNIESTQLSAFTEDDRQFAEIFGRYVAVAINILDLLVVERFTTTGQLASDVTTEIAGPLNDIISDATLLMDEYIGNDDMRKRLETIIGSVNKIRTSVKEVATGKTTILGMHTSEKARDPDLDGKRVLVADDEPNIRQTIADVLSRYGCKVDMAADGNEACALLAAQARYDLVLTDIKMPHKNGYEIFAAAKKIGHSPPVILMTGFGYDPNHSIVRASQEGLAAVLFKPFKVDQLVGEIKKAIKGGAKDKT
jgi:CheY-like chemotaxis protein